MCVPGPEPVSLSVCLSVCMCDVCVCVPGPAAATLAAGVWLAANPAAAVGTGEDLRRRRRPARRRPTTQRQRRRSVTALLMSAGPADVSAAGHGCCGHRDARTRHHTTRTEYTVTDAWYLTQHAHLAPAVTRAFFSCQVLAPFGWQPGNMFILGPST